MRQELSWLVFGKPDTSIALNGALAGLVSITAGCDIMSPLMAALTGAIGGCLVVFSVLFFERVRVDDPVGAISVHGICGAWGTLAIGLFSSEAGLGQLAIQAVGVVAGFAWAFPVSLVIFLVIKHTVGLRVSAEEEVAGLDVSEHGMSAYPKPLPAGVGSTQPATWGTARLPSQVATGPQPRPAPASS